MNKFLLRLNIVMAVINIVNGLVLERADCMIVALLNITTAYVLDKHSQKNESK